MGPDRFVALCKREYRIVMAVERARELIAITKARWSELPRYFAWASAMTEDGAAFVPDLLGGGIGRGGLSFTETCNTPFQRLGAHVAKSAGWAITRACYADPASPLFGSRVVNFIHDQFLIETPAGARAHDAAVETGRLMVEAAARWLPDVPATTTPCLASCWSKDATAVHDAGGRLVPWSPVEKLEVAA
jgi:hypothetical protein